MPTHTHYIDVGLDIEVEAYHQEGCAPDVLGSYLGTVDITPWLRDPAQAEILQRVVRECGDESDEVLERFHEAAAHPA
jgi:hypothetical protein